MSERDQLLKIAKRQTRPRSGKLTVRNAMRSRFHGFMKIFSIQLASCQNNISKWKISRNFASRKESTQAVYSKNVKTIADEVNEFFSTVHVGARAAQ